MNPSSLTNANARLCGRKLVSLAALSAGVLVGTQISAPAQSGAHGRGFGGFTEARLQPAVSGVVRDAAGAPQVGALVELLNPSLAVIERTFTDDRGRYALPAVPPGTYEVKASGSLFLPTLRENLRLLANSRIVVNLTLNTLFQAFQWLPAQTRSADEPKDDWNWTLRLSTNRPLLRVLEDDNAPGPLVLVSDGPGGGALDRRVTVRSGANRFGEGGMHQDIEVERDHDDAHQLILRTDVGQTDTAAIRSTAAYLRQVTPGAAVITVASFSDQPDVLAGGSVGFQNVGGLQVMTLRSAATMDFGPDVKAEVGSELEAVHLGQTLAASHPFASVTVHHGQTTVRYSMAHSPEAQQAAELDRDATLSARLTERDGVMRLEQGLHQALEVQHQFAGNGFGHWTAGVAYFHDALEHPLVGGGVAVLRGRPALADSDLEGGNLLYDPATQLIAVSGQSYDGGGLLAIARDQLTPDTWLSLRYAVGQALALGLDPGDLDRGDPAPLGANPTLARAVAGLRPHPTPMLAASFGSTVERSHTAWRASYRWQPSDTLTQVAPFDSSAPEAYLSFHMRQPIQVHYMGLRGVQAIVDVRNLLAQGYRPFLSQDGSTLYFAQAERCVEGGLSFSF